MTGQILVLGASGGVGGAVTRALLERGWSVRALVRDPPAAAAAWRGPLFPEWVAGDAMERNDVVSAARGATAIFHGVNPPGYRHWDRLVLPMIDNSIEAARRAGGARLVLPGTIYNYDPAATPLIDEATPQQQRSRKGAIRVELERRLRAAAPEVPSLIVRAGDFFGPGARSSWFAQAMAKAPLRAIQRLSPAGVGHSWAYLPDLAEAIVQLIERNDELAPAETVQFAGQWDPDGEQMIAAVQRMAGPDLPVRPFPWWLMRLLAPLGGFPREVMEVRDFWRHPVAFDNRRLISLLGAEPHTPWDVAVRSAITSEPLAAGAPQRAWAKATASAPAGM